mmetsp:Transcript_7150/g.24749  ORF Transcript_7150/g.24749 Transcript_7150/m.24749 type:complete len:192 (+) Transcript_7150:53-628(+)
MSCFPDHLNAALAEFVHGQTCNATDICHKFKEEFEGGYRLKACRERVVQIARYDQRKRCWVVNEDGIALVSEAKRRRLCHLEKTGPYARAPEPPLHPDCVLDIAVGSNMSLRRALETAQGLTSTVTMHFTPEGFRMTELNSYTVALIDIFLPPEEFRVYVCKEKCAPPARSPALRPRPALMDAPHFARAQG